MRRAVINLSYTNTSLLVAEDDDGKLISLYKGYVPFDVERYSSDLKVLSDKGSLKLADDISALVSKASGMGASDICVISTTLLRKTANSDDVRRILEKRTGIVIRQITGFEEARALWSVNERYSCLERPLLVNIGVSSTEICDYSRPNMEGMLSLPFGTAEIRENFISGNIPTKSEVKGIRSYVSSFLEGMDDDGFENAVLTGRNMNAVYSLYRDFFAVQDGDEFLMQRSRLNSLYLALMDRRSSDALIDRNCPEKRPFIIPAIIVLRTIVTHFRISNMTVSPLGIKEGWMKMMVGVSADGRPLT